MQRSALSGDGAEPGGGTERPSDGGEAAARVWDPLSAARWAAAAENSHFRHYSLLRELTAEDRITACSAAHGLCTQALSQAK